MKISLYAAITCAQNPRIMTQGQKQRNEAMKRQTQNMATAPNGLWYTTLLVGLYKDGGKLKELVELISSSTISATLSPLVASYLRCGIPRWEFHCIDC